MENAYGLEIPQNLAEACNPRRTALLVWQVPAHLPRRVRH